MGLEERRKIKDYQDRQVPERTAELAEITGSPIAYDIDWTTFADDPAAINFLDNVAFHRINMAMRALCIDQLAKDALRDGLKTIRIKNVKEEAQRGMSLAAGVLDMRYSYAQGLSGAVSDREIYQTLVKAL